MRKAHLFRTGLCRNTGLVLRTAASFILIGCISFSRPIDVQASSVDSMTIDVSLQEDGSAVVTQYWEDAYADEGTEYYLYYKDSGYLSFSDLSVSDASQEYEYIGAWDIDADFDEKAYCCGIHDVDDGVELCWGISEYGDNDFVIRYTIDNLVCAYEDADGIFYRFINSMDFFPTDAVVSIHMADGTPLTEDNASIWAFGYDGDIVFADDGTIQASTDSSLIGEENMTLLLELDPSLFSSAYPMDGTLADVIDLALEDSDYIDSTFSSDYYSDEYDEGSGFEVDISFGVIAFFAIAYGVFAGIRAIFRRKKEEKFRQFYESCPYFSGIPNEGNLDVSYTLARKIDLCEDGAAVSLYLMRMMISGAIQPTANEVYPDKQDLLLFPEKTDGSARERKLMELLLTAANGEKRLTSDQLMGYTEANYTRFDSFCSDCEEAGYRFLRTSDCLYNRKFNTFQDLNDNGRTQLTQLIGLKRYLTAMAESLRQDDKTPELPDELMIYAVLFDLLPQFEYYYRSEMNNTGNIYYREGYYNDPMYFYFYYGNTCSQYGHEIHRHVSNRRAEAARAAAASGDGGSASFSGGSGFSGGGGGGTR